MVDEQPTVALRRDRAVPPHRRRGQPRREDLLRELPHRDLVVVDRLPTRARDRVRPRHHRREQQRASELRHQTRIERASRDLSNRYRAAQTRKPSKQIEACARATDPGNKRPPRKPPHGLHQATSLCSINQGTLSAESLA